MTQIKLQIKNIDKITDAFKKAPAIATEEMSRVIERTGFQIQRDAIREAPVNKMSGGGNLRQSIGPFKMIGKLAGALVVNAKYAIFVHEGTSPHEIRPRTAKVLADKRNNRFFGKLVHHPGTKAQPFLQTAVSNNTGYINRELLRVAENILRRMFT